MDPRALLLLQAATFCVLAPDGRMLRVNSADDEAPPRLYMSGSTTGWIARLRHDVSAATAARIEALVAHEPPVTAPGATPLHGERYRELLGVTDPLTAHNYGPIHRVPHETKRRDEVVTVASGTPAGEFLIARIQRDGMPAGLVEAGFTDLSHFWEPWCVALAGAEIAALAFAARLSTLAADVGVFTLAPFRGRGFAAAVTAAWSAHPELQHRTLFYSTHRDNLSSQRVIARLGLPFLGESMRI